VKDRIQWILAGLWIATWMPAALAQTCTNTIQVDQPGAVISSNLFGIFFEEINFAGEGGLYAEMVRNRSFYNSANADYWSLITQGTASGVMGMVTNRPLNSSLRNSLRLTKQSGTGSVGAGNSGFWGLSVQSNAMYDLSFYAAGSNDFTGPLNVRLENSSGNLLYAQASFNGLTTNWQRFAASLVPTSADTNARLVLSLTNNSTVWLDMVSLFPRATFRGRTNGLRSDLANSLADLRPSFLRYPGGNYIEGNYLTNAVRWKRTVGDPALRPGHMNDAWGYWSTDGFGYHEFLQFCEDLRMEPLYGINCGLALGYNGDTNNTVPLSQMGPWVQDALDAIQYANGNTNTTWGALRAANGHPTPFDLKYIEIGNENGGSYYNDRYSLFYDAIKSNYPNVHLIANVWGGTPSSRPVEIQDEHYYASPAAFISYATKYDGYSRSGPKVFVGEYAVCCGGNGNLAGALGEAAFMTGLERNSDVVQLASYAPLFANVNGIQWSPDLIYYDNTRLCGTPSYYVQQMFSQNRGDCVLPATLAGALNITNPPPRGGVGLGSWNTSVQYTNIVVASNGVTLYQSDFGANGTNGWRVYNGTWSARNDLYQQTAIITDCRSTTGNSNWANYTLTLRARKVSGNEGFLILFNWLTDSDWTWWNIGGWNNTQHAIEQSSSGNKTTISPAVAGSVTTGQWYDIRIVLTRSRIQCYLNGTVIHDVTYPTSPGTVLTSASYAKAPGEIVLKTVNASSIPVATTFILNGVKTIAPTATLIQLTSANASDENSLSAPTNVCPATTSISSAGTNFTLTLPANSLSVLRLQASGIDFITNLVLQVSSPIAAGQNVASTVLGQKPGSTNGIDLTTNSIHAIAWSSADPSIAAVDGDGNVTGVAPGTTHIIAAYPALGLSATQAVQVVGPQRALVHRYSFNDLPGSSVAADSVGGPAWNGQLPNGGTFADSRLSLAAADQQYVRLPAGILSNFAALTIEAWVTFPNQLPVNCFFYGFGSTDASGDGADYVFCAPQGGRIAITGADPGWAGEQNAAGAGDLSFHTNLHFVAVYNPPAGVLALYTNGVLVAQNNAITVPLSSVSSLLNYIGRSLYNSDPYPDVVLDEFRLYNWALRPNEIAATQVLGPSELLTANVSLQASLSGTNLVLTWPVAAAGFTLESKTSMSGTWLPVPPLPQIVGGSWQVTTPLSGEASFFRLRQ
jgi:alpha-L-arabinofuranosidase